MEIKEQIDLLVQNNPVVLFMKGSKDRPQCGFSKQVVDVLRQLVDDFIGVDVLAYPQLREGIKIYSSWPTIPQLYVNGEFIGGCDIVLDLWKNHELPQVLGIKKALHKPTITVSDTALAIFNKAMSDCPKDERVRLSINTNFEYALDFGQKQPEDFHIHVNGTEMLIDPYSALRADHLHIDYMDDGSDDGFCFDNPNEPPPVLELSVEDLKIWQDNKIDTLLIDVRTPEEWDLAKIPSAKLLANMSRAELSAILKNQTIILYCHRGGRSLREAEAWRKKGFLKLYNLTGGIDAWSRRIDQNVPVYSKSSLETS